METRVEAIDGSGNAINQTCKSRLSLHPSFESDGMNLEQFTFPVFVNVKSDGPRRLIAPQPSSNPL